MKKALFQRIFFSIGFFFIFALTYKMALSYINAAETEKYIEAQCTILKNNWNKGADSFRLDLEYSYEYDQKKYTATRYMWGMDNFSNQNIKGAKSFVKRATVGSIQPCYVNPKAPEDSVIYKGNAYENYLMLILMVFLLLFGWGFFLSWFYPDLAEKTFTSSDSSDAGD